MLRSLSPFFFGAAATCAALAADSAQHIQGFAPVTVSSANYRATPREELMRAVEQDKAAVNPEAPKLEALKTPQRFVFMRGEIFESDLTYDQVTEILAAALRKKGYVNAADAQGRIYAPEEVTLVLRVNYGTRLWRLPTVRTQGLAWDDGLIARPRGPGLHHLGSDVSWDQRAGGNDDVFAAMAANEASPAFGGFSGGSAPGGAAAAGGGTGSIVATAGAGSLVAGQAEFGSTREFHLIVVDAFDYRELKQEGRQAKRLWSTFVSAPKQRKQRFSEMAETLARNAIPYFGETTRGLQIYSDVRAEVKIGELVEVKDPPPAK